MRFLRSLATRQVLAIAVILGGGAVVASADDLGVDLERVAQLTKNHDYSGIIELLSPYRSMELNPEADYIVAAELGRALYHMGRYRDADELFRKAVKLRPDLVETALYLEATSYLLGNHDQALAILGAVLQGGARDLWLAVTLPGERLFLADPRVWQTLQDHTIPLQVDLETGSIMGADLGQARREVVTILGAGPGMSDAPVITANAGPTPIWAFAFSDDGILTHVMLHAEHLLRYTPYRIDLGPGLDWQATPLAASAVLGPPLATLPSTSGDLTMSWVKDDVAISLVFGEPIPPRPPVLPGSAGVLKLIHLRLQPAGK